MSCHTPDSFRPLIDCRRRDGESFRDERMADFFANATLKKKLIGITMLVCSIVMFLTSAAFIGAEIFSFRKIMVGNSASLAGVIAANSAIALTFNDSQLAQNTLAALKAEPHIQLAYLFDLNHQPIARYIRQSQGGNEPGRPTPELSQVEIRQLAEGIRAGIKSHHFATRHLATFCPVYFEDEMVGMVYLNADMSAFYRWLHFFCGAGIVVVGLSFLLAYLLSIRLQQLVSRPILYLVEKMRQVSVEEDFTIRAQKESQDEVGALVDGFNHMLTRIEERDEQLESYRKHLEELVFKRTAELRNANEQLRNTVTELEKTKTGLEAAGRAKSQFLASISHELRTPMVGVLGTSELLMNTGLDMNQRHLVETLNRSGEGLLTILNDLLDLSKIEAGKLNLERIDFNLLEVVETPVQLLGKSANDKHLELICHCESNVPMALHGDPGRLRQVIFNLLGNAIKFTPSGEVVLRVMVEQIHPTSVVLRFEVTDTGIGIAPEAQQKIFEAFCQADDSVTRNFGGTGLGLSIVRQLVEKMGGQVGLASEPGIGSTFYFTVGLGRQKERAVAPVHLAIAGQRVLAVDDNRSVCRMLGGRLAARGFAVEMARSAEEAIRLLREGIAAGRPFAAIFLNADMPDDGCCRIVGLLTEPPFAGTRLVVMASREAVPSWAVPNGSTCIYKPLMPSQVDEGIAGIQSRPTASDPDDIRPAPGSERAGGGRGRILIAEDNPTTQNLLKISLGSIGHEVMVADNGRSALEMWRNQSFDLVLMDFHMPEMDGCTVAREMRSAGCDLPIIGLTAHSSTEYVDQCLSAGMDDFLSKPFKQKHLHQLVERWLMAGRAAGTSEGCNS